MDPKQFVLAGRAIFTVTSLKTGSHFTFRAFRGNREDSPTFVGVLTGQNNLRDYSFLGTIFRDESFRHSPKSRISQDAPSAKAFLWFWRHINNLPGTVSFSHAGRCAVCGRLLTSPESLLMGVGPECKSRLS